jgi:hypothetical protein
MLSVLYRSEAEPDPIAPFSSSRDTRVSISDGLLRLMYSMAVVRLVNGVADSSQRGRVAASVASLASQAGEKTCSPIPSLFPMLHAVYIQKIFISRFLRRKTKVVCPAFLAVQT